MREDTLRIYEAAMSTRRKLDADQGFGPSRREFGKSREPRRRGCPYTERVSEVCFENCDGLLRPREPLGSRCGSLIVITILPVFSLTLSGRKHVRRLNLNKL
jgi:hypothetical protein